MFLSPSNISPLRRSNTAVTPIIVPSFNLPSALHEWNYENATVVGTTTTVTDTGSIGLLDMANPSAISQPVLTANELTFDGISQYIIKNTTNFRGSDATGVFHAKGHYSGTDQYLFMAGDTSGSNAFISFKIRSNGTVRLLYYSSVWNILQTNLTIASGTDFTVSVYGSGADVFIIINGVKITSYSTNTILNRWLDYPIVTKGATVHNISVSARVRTAIDYGVGSQKYVCYEPYTSEADALTNHNTIRNTVF